ncbi:MAG: hypothetical protein R2758_03310 [Bacteroidales bacterium]
MAAVLLKLSKPKSCSSRVLHAKRRKSCNASRSFPEKAWDITYDTGTNIVEVYVNILRKKIDRDFETKLIHTRITSGIYFYRLINEDPAKADIAVLPYGRCDYYAAVLPDCLHFASATHRVMISTRRLESRAYSTARLLIEVDEIDA